jgi:rhodanese-related sulfurtransferase
MSVPWKYVVPAAIAITTLIVFVGYIYATDSPLRIGPKSIRSDDQVVDVRSDPEWALGHYHGAIHIPIGKLEEQAAGLLDRSKRVVVYCNTGQRSRFGAEKLVALGYNAKYIKEPYWAI